MNEPSSDPFDSTTATWASPLEQMLATPDAGSHPLEAMAVGGLAGDTAAQGSTFAEAADGSLAPQLSDEFQTHVLSDSASASSEFAAVTMLAPDEHVPTIDSVDQMFDTAQDPTIHDQTWTDDHAGTAVHVEQFDGHDAALHLDAGGIADPFAVG